MHTNWEVGQTIDGKYEIFGSSSGGMGAVYFVNHLMWKIPLAVKTPLLTLINSPSAYRRYIKEAETWINIGMHPHIVSCFYVRDLDGIPRIFIEYVSGGTLKDLIDKNRFGDISYILDLAIQFSMAMEYVHDLGIIHRDIKPANCMITSDGELKVTDFGIAKLGDDVPDTDDNPHIASSHEGLTMTGTGFGTPEYMAPEQFLDAKNIGKEADIYSFGVMLYEMVCGVRPFVMPSGMNTHVRDYFYRNAHFNEIPRPPIESDRRIPQSLNRIIMKCLEKDVAKRFHCFSDISSALLDCCNEAGNPNKRIKPDVLKLKADSLNNKAISLLDLGKCDDAVSCWRQSLAEDPQHLEATFNFGYYRWKEGALYRDVLRSQMANLKRRHDDNHEFWRLLAWLYYEVGDIDTLEEIQNSSHRVTNAEFLKLYNELNTQNGRWLRTYKGSGIRNAQTVTFSADGRYVFSGSIVGLRQWGGTSGKEFTHFELPKGYVRSFVFSPDGNYVLAGCERGLIVLLDVVTGKEIRRFEWSGEHVDFDNFSIDAESLGENVFNRIVSRKILNTYIVNSVAFSPDSSLSIASVTACYSCMIKWQDDDGNIYSISLDDHPDYNVILQFDTNTGREIQCLKASGKINSVAFSPDGKYILSGGSQNNISMENTLSLWDVVTGKDLRRFDGYNECVNSVAFSPDGKLAISAGTLTVWELATGKVLSRFEDNCAPVAFSPDGRFILSGSYQNDNTYENTLTLRDVATGNEVRRFEGHSGRVNAVAFSPGGRYILTGGWEAIRLYSWEPLKRAPDVGLYPVLSRIRPPADMVTESKEVQSHLTAAHDLIEKGNYKEAYQYLRKIQSVSGYEKNKEVLNQINICGVKGHGARKSFRNAWHVFTFKGHKADISSVTFSPDGKYILSGSSGEYYDDVNENEIDNIRLWEIGKYNEIRSFKGFRGAITSVVFSHDGRYVISGGGELLDESDDETGNTARRTIIVWDAVTGTELRRFEVYDEVNIFDFIFSPDARYVLSWGADENVIRIWDLESGKEIKQFKGYKGSITSAIFTPDGRYILAGDRNNKVVMLLDFATGKELKRFGVYGVFLCDNIFSTDGKYILFGGQDRRYIRLWEIATGKEYRHLAGQSGRDLRHAVFSPDGSYVLSWGEGHLDDTLRLWNSATGKVFTCYSASARSVSFSPDSRHLTFSNSDNDIVLLELDWEWEFPEESRLSESSRGNNHELCTTTKSNFICCEQTQQPTSER